MSKGRRDRSQKLNLPCPIGWVRPSEYFHRNLRRVRPVDRSGETRTHFLVGSPPATASCAIGFLPLPLPNLPIYTCGKSKFPSPDYVPIQSPGRWHIADVNRLGLSSFAFCGMAQGWHVESSPLNAEHPASGMWKIAGGMAGSIFEADGVLYMLQREWTRTWY